MNESNNQILEEFIKEKFKVSSHKIPFYFKWINLYKKYIIRIGAIEKKPDSFIVSLQSQYPDWQVKQAEKAVTIYLSFIGKNKKSGTSGKTKDNLNWKNVIFRMK